MTKTELKKQQTKGIIELLESKFNAENFDNDQGSYFTFNIGEFEGSLVRNRFEVMMHDNIKMGDGFSEEEYNIRDASAVLEKTLQKAINDFLENSAFNDGQPDYIPKNM